MVIEIVGNQCERLAAVGYLNGGDAFYGEIALLVEDRRCSRLERLSYEVVSVGVGAVDRNEKRSGSALARVVADALYFKGRVTVDPDDLEAVKKLIHSFAHPYLSFSFRVLSM